MYPTLSPRYVITNVSIVDVLRSTTLPQKTVIVDNERINSIQDSPIHEHSDNYQTIDGNGLWLLPGLIDSHVHYFDPETFGPLLLQNGIVLVRDMGNPTDQAIQLREALHQRNLLGPEMITTGWILDGDPAQIPPISKTCKTKAQGRALVQQQVLAGVDQIKVYSDLEKDIYLSIIDEAHKLGIKPVGHIPESIYIADAAKSGHCSCEHLFGFEKMIAKLLGDEIKIQKGGMGAYIHYWTKLPEVDRNLLSHELRKMQKTGMLVCPTLVVFFGHARANEIFTGTYPFLENVSPLIRDIWKRFWNPSEKDIELYQKISPQMQRFVFELYKAGIPLLIGTDLTTFGIIPGHSLHEEMRLWQAAGIPPIDILRSATLLPARFFNMDSDLGTIEPGKFASMVLVKGNPLENIIHAGEVAAVFLRGKLVYSEKENIII